MNLSEMLREAADLRRSAESDYRWAVNGALSLEYNAYIALGDSKAQRATALENQARSMERDLQRIRDYGFLITKNGTAKLVSEGFIVESEPTEALPYLHHKLTEKGEAFFAKKSQA